MYFSCAEKKVFGRCSITRSIRLSETKDSFLFSPIEALCSSPCAVGCRYGTSKVMKADGRKAPGRKRLTQPSAWMTGASTSITAPRTACGMARSLATMTQSMPRSLSVSLYRVLHSF